MRRDIDAEVARLAGPRAGAFHRLELYRIGGDRYLARRRCASGAWLARSGDVFTLASHPDSFEQTCWTGILTAGPGGHLSFETGAQLHQVHGVERGHVVVTTRRANHVEVPGITFHQLDDVRPSHLQLVDGFPTTTPERTVIDLAAVLSPTRLGVVIEDVVVRRLVSFSRIHQVLGEVRRRGKPGITMLVSQLDARQGEPPPASELEALLYRAVGLAGLPLSRQHPLPTRAEIRGLVDGAIVESKLIVEADGRRWHARMDAMANDRRRDREAARLGWQTLRFVHEDLIGDLAGAVDDIATTHRLRTRG